MNITKRQRRLAAQKEMKKPEGIFAEIDLSTAKNQPFWMTRAFRNHKYIVMINDNAETSHGKAIRAMIQKHDDTPILNHWAEMQRIKNEVFGKDVTAIEYYPSEENLINDHNIYWMFIYPSGVLPIPF